MRILLQLGVAVRGEHLAMGVDVDPHALRLLEQLFQVLEIVAGDEDRFSFDGSTRTPVGTGSPKLLVWAASSNSMTWQIHRAAFEREGGETLDRGMLVGQRVQRGATKAQTPPPRTRAGGRDRVRGETFETICDQFLKPQKIFSEGRAAGGEAHFLTLVQQAFRRARRFPCGRDPGGSGAPRRLVRPADKAFTRSRRAAAS